MTRPYFIDWAITNKCNLNCEFCTGLSKNELSTEEALKLSHEIISLKPDWIILEGGEPFLRKDLKEILKVLSKCKIYIITNGNIEIDIDILKEFNVRVLFSFDGPDEKTYKEIKGGDFKKVMENMEICSREKILHGVTAILSKKNLGKIKEFFEILNSFQKPIFLIFIPLKPSKNYEYYKENSLSKEEQKEAIKEIFEYSSKYNIYTYYDEPFLWLYENIEKRESGVTVSEHKGCVAGKTIYIQANGEVNYCMFSPSEISLGNVTEKSLKEIWQEILNSKLLKEFKNKEMRKGKCGNCEYFEICFGCLSRIFKIYNTHLESDPSCPL